MSVKIRLARGGSKKRPYYRIVAANSRSPRDGDFLERLGSFNPVLPDADQNRIVLNGERIKHWLSCGAQPTDRVAKFLRDAGILNSAVTYKAENVGISRKEVKKLAEEKATAAKQRADELKKAKAEAAKEAEASKAAEAAAASAAEAEAASAEQPAA
jgi:small subunit ribosomal protein S16